MNQWFQRSSSSIRLLLLVFIMWNDFEKHHKQICVAATGIFLGSSYLYHTFKKWKTAQEKEMIRKTLRGRRDAEIQALKVKLRSVEVSADNEIIKLSFDELTEQLQNGKLKSYDVLRAYQAKAVEVHEKTNCLTGTILDSEQRAKDQDKCEEKGPLHGVPVSIKDSITLKGYFDTWGCANRARTSAAEDAVMIKVLLAQGAVPFVRTNVPQLLLSHETSNQIYGQTNNPVDTSRCSGGSSGGEGALIGGGGAVVGLGTDIGGSIRTPSSFCGVYGLKPGNGRLSNITGSHPRGQTIILPTIGPMARDMDGLVTMTRCLLVPLMYELDPLIPPLPFKEEIYKSTRPLRIGWFVDDGYYPAVPSMARAVLEAKRALEKAGHTLVPWQPPHVKQAVSLFTRTLTGDKGALLYPALSNDSIDPCIESFVKFVYISQFVRRFKSLSFRMKGWKNDAQMLEDCSGFNSVAEWWIHTTTAEIYRRMFSAKWKEEGLDTVIGPSSTLPASKHGSSAQKQVMGSYTYLYNLLDFPAGILPVTRVTEEDVSKLARYDTGDYMSEWVREDQAGSKGLPVCVQVAGLRWQEELVLRVMKVIQEGVNYQ